MAVEAGLRRAELAVRRGEIDALPPVFFNMDADSVLGAQALERMVAKLVRAGRSPAADVRVVRLHVFEPLRSSVRHREDGAPHPAASASFDGSHS